MRWAKLGLILFATAFAYMHPGSQSGQKVGTPGTLNWDVFGGANVDELNVGKDLHTWVKEGRSWHTS
jgi:hypothetical protein